MFFPIFSIIFNVHISNHDLLIRQQIKEKLATQEVTTSQFSELQEQYDAILQMYGEKVEETEELQLDLQDVKDMYRTQIDDLLVQQRLMQQRIQTLQQEIGKK